MALSKQKFYFSLVTVSTSWRDFQMAEFFFFFFTLRYTNMNTSDTQGIKRKKRKEKNKKNDGLGSS